MTKKQFFKVVLSTALVSAMVMGTPAAVRMHTPTQVEAASHLSKNEAVDAVLKDAGLSKNDIEDLDVEYKKKSKKYEVEFETKTYEYEYAIKRNGNITSKEMEIRKEPVQNKNAAKISEARAKSIAFQTAGISEADAKKIKVTQKTDDDLDIFKVTFKSGSYKYEYKLDAYTGVLLEMERKTK